MDPITIMSILVLAGFIGAGADLATGGLVRAELGGGSQGAAGYLGSAGRKRWQESRRLARQERMTTPMGRAVQFVLDEVGGLGRGLVRGWRSGARRGRKAWRERIGDGPLPAVRICQNLGDQTRTWLDQHAIRDTPNGAGQDPIEARTDTTPNGHPERPWWIPGGGPEQDPEQDPDGPNEETPNDDPDPEQEAGQEPAPPLNETPNDDPEQAVPPTRTEGTTVTDINSAPAAIAAWEAITPRWESLQSRTDALQGEIDSLKAETDALDAEIATLAGSMGDFAIGGEGDVAGAIGEVTASLASAKEQVDNATTGFTSAKERTGAYVDNLHLEYDASIEAAAGKVADAHSVMQEV